MKKKKVFLNEFRGKEIESLLERAEQITAILCFGSCENHGAHCCLGPDFFVPTEVAKRVAERLDNVIVLPCIPYGVSINYNHYPLSVTLRYETEIALAEDMMESLIHNNIRRLFIFNGHDGNIAPLEIAARKVKERHKDAKIIYFPAWWQNIGPMMENRFEVWNGLGHGGEGETSIVMALDDDYVELKDAVEQVPHEIIRLSKDVTIVWDISEVSKTGATGDPTKATKEKGEQMLELLVDLVSGIIEERNSNKWKY